MSRGPQTAVIDALRRHWWVVALCVVAGAGLGIAYGVTRDPGYTAEARLSVGRVNVQTQAIPGFNTASLSLADTYSRAIVARPVTKSIVKHTKLSKQAVLDRVSASPIPETATVRVFAEAGSERRAVDVANAAAHALVAYVRRLNRFNPDSELLLNRYEEATQAYGKARAERARAGGTAAAEAKVQRARLRMRTLGGLYQSSQAGQASPNTLQVLALAGDAGDDRSATMQQAALVGGVAGLALGALVVVRLAFGRERSWLGLRREPGEA